MGWGDDIMVTGQARLAQQRDPRKVRVMLEKGPRWSEVYRNNPRIAGPDETGDFQLLQVRQGFLRPYMTAKTAEQWHWQAWQPPRGEIYLSAAERAFGDRHRGRILLEPHNKAGASPNKEWGWIRWNKLAWQLKQRGYAVAQMGSTGTAVLEGAEHIVTPSFRHALAVLSQAVAAVLPEGGLHHAAAAFDVPAVVIYGGFISPAVTGYAGQVSLFSKSERYPLGCGMRVRCPHCQDAMASIDPAAVADQLENVLVNQGMARPVAA